MTGAAIRDPFLALWRLARPAGMPLVLALPATGYGFALWDRALPLIAPGSFALVLAAWWLLSAGTLWLNAALDQDDDDVLMAPARARLPDPAHLPTGLWGWGLAALAAATATAWAAGPVPGALATACSLLAVGYSHPRTAWKGHPVLGPAINVAGYGLASPIAGFSVAESPPTGRAVFALALLAAWVGATYFGAQGFQHDADASRGYRTLVVTAGPRTTILTARALYAVAIGGLVAGTVYGLFPRLVTVVVVPWAWLDSHLARWAAAPELGVAAGRTMLRRATVLAATVMAGVTAAHLIQLHSHGPPGGMGTAWRPTLP